MAQLVANGLDHQTIGGCVLEPFPQPQARPFVAGALEHDLAILERIERRVGRPILLASCSRGAPGKRHENEKPRPRTDQLIKQACLQFTQELLRSIAAETEIENPLLAVEQIRE